MNAGDSVHRVESVYPLVIELMIERLKKLMMKIIQKISIFYGDSFDTGELTDS